MGFAFYRKTWMKNVAYHYHLRSLNILMVTIDLLFRPAIYVFLVYLKSFLSIFINFSFLYALLNDRKRLAVISLLLILADSFLFLSRGPLVSLLFIVLLAQFFSISKKTLNRSSSNKKNLIFLVILIIFIAAISFIRQDGFLSFIRDYLLIGPVIFSSLVSGLFDNSYCGPLNMPIVFSGIDYLVAIFLRGILHVDFHSIGYDWIKLIDEQVLTGSSGFEFIYHNAFYTILAEPFKAMGMSGVAALGWFFGYFLHKLSWAYRKFSCEYSLLLLSYLWVILLTGIFGNALASPILWLFLIAMPIVKRVIFTPVIIKAHK